MSKVSCQPCGGTGIITTMGLAPIKGCKLRSSTHMAPANRFCDACTGSGKVETAAGKPVPSPARITFGGHTITAPGFDQVGFERAMARALVDTLQLRPEGDAWYVFHPRGGGYVTTREHCQCLAGEHGQPCKHRAALIFHLDLREPALQREWQCMQRTEARKVAA